MTHPKTRAILAVNSAQERALASALEHAGFTVTVCRSGTDALALLSEHSEVSLLVAHTATPLLRGFELVRRYLDSKRTGRAVLVCANDDAVPIVGHPRLTVLVEPVSAEALLAALQPSL
ncbi:MAG: hypothetical protein Q8P18_02935 [Pseudomonadota bacterium]|nr:hypothetical protein [Pseudomonadota bacterium]